MWTDRQSLRLSVVSGLRKGLSLIRGAWRTFSEEEQYKIAEDVVKELESSNWKIEQGAPAEGAAHISGSGKK